MTPGALVRRLLGPLFRPVGELYRRIFVDMPRVVAAIDPHIPTGARVLDVGGGDGYVVDLLLTRRCDLTVTMTDIAGEVGGFIRPANRSRVRLLPRRDMTEVVGAFDIITLSDVIHHVPLDQRPGFLDRLSLTADQVGCDRIVIKDIEPAGLRAKLSLLSDLHVTGDSGVALARSDSIVIPGFRVEHRFTPDHPNYCLVFDRSAVAGR